MHVERRTIYRRNASTFLEVTNVWSSSGQPYELVNDPSLLLQFVQRIDLFAFQRTETPQILQIQ